MAVHIVAVVVTYNRKACLLRCIDALRGQKGAHTDILVVDNASTDGTAEALAPLMEQGAILYRNTGENLGGAGGFNFGMRLAVEAGYDRLWVMDDDCIPDPDALAALLQADRQLEGNYGFLSGMAYWRDGSLCQMNIQKTGLWRKLEDPTAPLTPVVMATFVSAFIPAERVRQVGLPIREFFIWSDDLEYTRRLSRRWPCYAVGDSRVLHDMRHNNKVNIATDSLDRLDRYAYLYRNEVYVYRREGLVGWLYLITRVGLHLFKIWLRSPVKGKRMKVILSSFAAGLRFRPQVERVERG